MPIKTPQGFDVLSKELIDQRLVLTKAQMQSISNEDEALRKDPNFSSSIYPDRFLALCVRESEDEANDEDFNHLFLFDYTNSLDTPTGKFRLYESVTNWDNIAGKPFEKLNTNSVNVNDAKELQVNIEEGSAVVNKIDDKVKEETTRAKEAEATEKEARIAGDTNLENKKADKPKELPPELKVPGVDYPWFMINLAPKGVDADGKFIFDHSGYNLNSNQYYTWKNQVLPLAASKTNGGFMTAADKIALDQKVDGVMESPATGKAIIFNELDGGGAKFERNGTGASYVGVHNESNGVGAQIYDVDADNKGVIIDVTRKGAYYHCGEFEGALARDVEKNEIMTPSRSVVDNVDTADKNKALSANQGKLLNDRIKAMESFNRYLSVWDCTRGLPVKDPQTSEFIYKAGDFYRVGKVFPVKENNLIPEGESYKKGVASTKHYDKSEPLNTGDLFIYNGKDLGWQHFEVEQYDAVYDILGPDGNTIVVGGVAKLSKFALNGKEKILESEVDDLHISKIIDLATSLNNKVDKVNGESLVADTEIEKLKTVSNGANKVEVSEAKDGKITVDGVDKVVYELPKASADKIGGGKAIEAPIGIDLQDVYITNDGKLVTHKGEIYGNKKDDYSIDFEYNTDEDQYDVSVNISEHPGNALEHLVPETGQHGGLYVKKANWKDFAKEVIAEPTFKRGELDDVKTADFEDGALLFATDDTSLYFDVKNTLGQNMRKRVLENVDNTADKDKPVSTAQQEALDKKVDKVEGKGLSTNDFTNDDRLKLDSIEISAQKNYIVKAGSKEIVPVEEVAGKTLKLGALAALDKVGKDDIDVSTNPITSDEIRYDSTHTVKEIIDTKQNKLTAGTNISIVDDVISAASGEPATYIKSASVSGNKLTLKNKDDSDVEFNVNVPTKTSELTNDSGFLTEHQSLVSYRKAADQDIIDYTKVDKEIVSDKGKARIFNEADGGGSKFERTDGASYVGVHNEDNGVGAQIYDVDSSNKGVILDITRNGAYYHTGDFKPASQRDVEDNEIVVKKDLSAKQDKLIAGAGILIAPDGKTISATGISIQLKTINGEPLEGTGNISLARPGDLPTKTSQLTNDSGFLTEHQSLADYRKASDQDTIDNSKVDKVEGKGLSTNDFDNKAKTKLNSINVNSIPSVNKVGYQKDKNTDTTPCTAPEWDGEGKYVYYFDIEIDDMTANTSVFNMSIKLNSASDHVAQNYDSLEGRLRFYTTEDKLSDDFKIYSFMTSIQA